MKYIPSINIESGIHNEFQYIVTPNAKEVLGNIISSFHSGIHSFTIIGNYGTGKSSFIIGLEKDLEYGTSNLVTNKEAFGDVSEFEFMNIVGDYTSLSDILASKLNIANFIDSKNIFEALSHKYKECKKQGKFLFMVIDEFGKILEYAANNNPERELYFVQKLAEFVNQPSRNIILLTTLHQNFGSYAYKLNDTQRNEWLKIKGRFKEIVFVEPVEQLMRCYHLGGIGGYNVYENDMSKCMGRIESHTIPVNEWSFDCLPVSGLLRIMSRKRMIVGASISNFEIYFKED